MWLDHILAKIFDDFSEVIWMRGVTLPSAFLHLIRSGGQRPLDRWNRVTSWAQGNIHMHLKHTIKGDFLYCLFALFSG